MNVTKTCTQYCIGCGLCKSERNIEMNESAKGYLYPMLDKSSEEFLKNVCPIMDNHEEAINYSSIWGNIELAVAAYSRDTEHRKKASSGGVLTALCLYLLEEGKVDGIIQVKADETNPTKTVCQVSTTRTQVLECCGSRYAISSPWMDLATKASDGKIYAAVGKPCDILALRRLKNNEKKYENIVYLLSFFCAGIPSTDAQKNLLSQIGIGKESCANLTYRGNGWPGYTTAVDKEGKAYTMEYSKAWGGILGRDVHPYCRLCIDGIGESADISCGDGWYIKDGQPDFTERDGRNIVFTRNSLGTKLLEEAAKAGYVVYENWEDFQSLEIIQKHQYTRKTTMRAKMLGYRVCGKKIPVYDKKLLKKYAKNATFKQKAKVFLGTMKRIVQRRI